MASQAQSMEPIPEEIQRIAKGSFPKGKESLALKLRDALEPIYQDKEVAHLFPQPDQSIYTPWRLAIITVLQAAAHYSDMRAAEMVQSRMDWRYALSLPFVAIEFEASVLTNFRRQLIELGAQDLVLEPILQVCREHGWLKMRGKKHIDATIVLSSIAKDNW